MSRFLTSILFSLIVLSGIFAVPEPASAACTPRFANGWRAGGVFEGFFDGGVPCTPTEEEEKAADPRRFIAPSTDGESCSVWDFSFGRCIWAPLLGFFGGFFLFIGGSLLSLAAYVFDLLVYQVIVGFGSTVKTLGLIDGIHHSWTVLRDVSNIVIIGMFTFIAISIIIGNHTFGEKKLVARVLVVAVLINFSLLFSKIIIDSSNFLAWQVYKSMAPEGSGNGAARGVAEGTGGAISSKFMAVVGMTSVFSGFGEAISQGQNAVRANEGTSGTEGSALGNFAVAFKGFFYGLFGGALLLIAAGVLFYGAYLIAVRAVLLIFLMLVSALAFATYLIPGMSGGEYGWSAWWKSLINASVFGPLLMLLLYVSLVVIKPAEQLREGALTPEGVKGGQDWTILITFIVGVGMLYVSIRVANSFSKKIAGFDMAAAPVGKAFGMAIGASALVGKWGGGFAATRFARSNMGQKLFDVPVIGRVARAGLYAASTGNWDMRSVPGAKSFLKATGMQLGEASKEGYLASLSGLQKKIKTREQAMADWEVGSTYGERRAKKDGVGKGGDHDRLSKENEDLEKKNAELEKDKETIRQELARSGGSALPPRKAPIGAEQSATPVQTAEQTNSRQKQELAAETAHIETSAATARNEAVDSERLELLNEKIAELSQQIEKNSDKIADNNKKRADLSQALRRAAEADDRINRRKDNVVRRTRNKNFFSLWNDDTFSDSLAKKLRENVDKTPEAREHDHVLEAIIHAAHPQQGHKEEKHEAPKRDNQTNNNASEQAGAPAAPKAH